VLIAGEAGFGFRAGEVWGVHVAFSGNHRTLAERTPGGVALLAGGELLLPGEVRLAPGEAYASPWVYGSHGAGLDALAARFHGYLRDRPQHPRTPRPVTMNTWEAVYFDQDLGRLTALADAAAAVGAERFVLDDGWFRGRRDDRAGLGDWYVDEQVWPAGLHPLVDHVRGVGLEFGLWVEPEMVNPDSGLARAHPDWILATGGRLPPASRHQQVLDLGNPAAYEHLLARLDALLRDTPSATSSGAAGARRRRRRPIPGRLRPRPGRHRRARPRRPGPAARSRPGRGVPPGAVAAGRPGRRPRHEPVAVVVRRRHAARPGPGHRGRAGADALPRTARPRRGVATPVTIPRPARQVR
jgi:hypothetical protein